MGSARKSGQTRIICNSVQKLGGKIGRCTQFHPTTSNISNLRGCTDGRTKEETHGEVLIGSESDSESISITIKAGLISNPSGRCIHLHKLNIPLYDS